VMMLLQLVWVLLLMPETKGVSLEDLSKSLGQYQKTINKS